MVPEDYHDFFVASAGVAGALIGLLFVAISIVPEKMVGESARIDYQTRAVVAFSALVDALVLALDSLVPGTGVAEVALAFSLIGLSSTVGAGLRMVSQARTSDRREQLRQRRAAMTRWERYMSDGNPVFVLRRVALLVGVYVVQLVDAVDFIGSPRSTDDVGILATLVLVCFLFSIDRAWELLGGSKSGILAVVFGRRLQRNGATPEAGAGAADPGAPGDAGTGGAGAGTGGAGGGGGADPVPGEPVSGDAAPGEPAPAGERPVTG